MRSKILKQINQSWRSLLGSTIAAGLFLGASFPAYTQDATYKVGDRVEMMSGGEWVEAEILEVKDGGYYVTRHIKLGVEGWQGANWIRPIKAGAQTDKPNNATNQVQTNGNAQTKAADGSAITQENRSIAERFGSREPRTCADTKAPAKGAITAALAQKYLECQMEYLSGSGDLYLVENVKVEVGGGIPYSAIRGQRSFMEIDVNHPVYPIRGSFILYQCRNQLTEYVGPPNTNAISYNNPNATGYCYKTTFGDWKCVMGDPASHNDANIRHKVAPPKP